MAITKTETMTGFQLAGSGTQEIFDDRTAYAVKEIVCYSVSNGATVNLYDWIGNLLFTFTGTALASGISVERPLTMRGLRAALSSSCYVLVLGHEIPVHRFMDD